jgi:hypothetical protein
MSIFATKAIDYNPNNAFWLSLAAKLAYAKPN